MNRPKDSTCKPQKTHERKRLKKHLLSKKIAARELLQYFDNISFNSKFERNKSRTKALLQEFINGRWDGDIDGEKWALRYIVTWLNLRNDPLVNLYKRWFMRDIQKYDNNYLPGPAWFKTHNIQYEDDHPDFIDMENKEAFVDLESL